MKLAICLTLLLVICVGLSVSTHNPVRCELYRCLEFAQIATKCFKEVVPKSSEGPFESLRDSMRFLCYGNGLKPAKESEDAFEECMRLNMWAALAEGTNEVKQGVQKCLTYME